MILILCLGVTCSWSGDEPPEKKLKPSAKRQLDIRSQNAALQSENNLLMSELLHKRDELAAARNEIKTSDTKLEQLNVKVDATLKEHAEALENQRERILKDVEKKQRSTRKVAMLKAKQREKIQALKSEHSAELRTLKADHAAKLQELREKMKLARDLRSGELEELRKKHEKHILEVQNEGVKKAHDERTYYTRQLDIQQSSEAVLRKQAKLEAQDSENQWKVRAWVAEELLEKSKKTGDPSSSSKAPSSSTDKPDGLKRKAPSPASHLAAFKERALSCTSVA